MFEINDLRKPLLYLETYSRREMLNSLGLTKKCRLLKLTPHPRIQDIYCSNSWKTSFVLKTLVVETSSKESIDGKA